MESRPLLLGHRGARGVKSLSENTLASFDFALASGCDGFEFDVQLTADRQAVICHDERTFGREIAQSSAKELGLPLLREVLARYQRTAFLDIELKVPGLETISAELLRNFPPVRGFMVSSFLPEVIEKLRGTDPAIPLGLICETRAQLSHWNMLPVEYVIPLHTLVRKELVLGIKNAGKKIFVWTVNSAAVLNRFSNWGVDGIISDKPKQLARILIPQIDSRK
jgi:glycerophosphoryl diester phosphodiesterase